MTTGTDSGAEGEVATDAVASCGPGGAAPTWSRGDRRWVAAIGGAAVVVAAAMIALTMGRTGGIPFLPLDDAFIYQRYAERLAFGGWYSYSDGGGLTSGATSPLYPWLLVPAFWVGLSGSKALPAALAWGVLFLLAELALVYELTKRAAHCGAAVVAAALVAASGYCLYFFMSGMETGLYAALVAATLVAAARLEVRPTRCAWRCVFGLGALLPLARPEGVVLTTVLGVWLLLRWPFRAVGGDADGDPVVGTGGFLLWLALLALPFALWEAAVWSASGTLQTNGYQLKGLTANPHLSLAQKAAVAADSLGALLAHFYANTFDYYPLRDARATAHPPLLLPLAALGFLLSAWRRGETLRRPGFVLLAAAMAAVGLASTSLNEFYHAHNYRYQAPYEPLLLVGYALGLWQVADLLAACLHARSEAPPRRDRLVRLLALAVVGVQALSLPWWVDFYASNGSDIYNQHRRMAWTWKDRLHRADAIGLTDAGVLPFYIPQADVHDYAGLVTNGAAPPMRAGLGSVWEAMEHLGQNQLPRINITYLDVMAAPDGRHFMGTPIGESRLLHNTVTGGGALVAFVPPWAAWGAFVAPGTQPPPGAIHSPDMLWTSARPLDPLPDGARVIDALDVADLADERAHAYTFSHGLEAPAPPVRAHDPRNVFLLEGGARPLGDGGRAIGAGESWQGSAPLTAGRRYRLLVRAARPFDYLGPQAPGIGITIELGGGASSSLTLPLDTVPSPRALVDLAADFTAPAVGMPTYRVRSLGAPTSPSVYMVFHYFVVELPE